METVAHKIARLSEAGRSALADGRSTAAISSLTQALYLQPDDASLLALRAEAHLKLCDLQSAIANLRKARKVRLDEVKAKQQKLAAEHDDGTGQPWEDVADALVGMISGSDMPWKAEEAEAATLGKRLAGVLDVRAVRRSKYFLRNRFMCNHHWARARGVSRS